MYHPQPLSRRHYTDSFDCGKEELNVWLSKWAMQAESNRTARTFVWTPQEEDNVVAYYSLAGHLVQRSETPTKVGRGGPNQIPSIILGRLALDRSLHGRGLGKHLLVNALSAAVRSSHSVAARLVVVDAIDEEAALFYEKYGFAHIPGDTRMFRKMSSIEADLSE
ncbi:GNAT family N-acetyltransferase [Streptosporangium saharense]|uniref:GNAT family N-acetyltransferase n=1 Tax=Streptosporangium saharense TaxID=1706840 RepID=UPI00332D7503